MGTKLLKCALTTQSITLFLTLITNGLSNNIFFALFWASTIISLITILSMKKWDLEEWFGFAAITFSMVGGVLFAIRALDREVFVIILIAILLFMAGTAQHRKLCIMKGESCGPCCQRRKKRLAKSKQAPQVIIVEEKIELPQKKTATQQTKSEESMKKGKKKATKKTSSKKKTTKKKVAKKKTSTKSKKASAISHNKYHKPKLPSKTKKKATKKTSSKKKTTKKKTSQSRKK